MLTHESAVTEQAITISSAAAVIHDDLVNKGVSSSALFCSFAGILATTNPLLAVAILEFIEANGCAPSCNIQ